jgi:hypothetical protein
MRCKLSASCVATVVVAQDCLLAVMYDESPCQLGIKSSTGGRCIMDI